MHLVETRDLCHTYADGTEALRGVNFTAGRAEIVAVLGANGAGKTTLFKHFNGLLHPSSGRVLVKGGDITKENLLHVRQTVGIVFQNPEEQLFAPSVYEDIAFGPRNLGLEEDVVEHRVKDSLRLVGMEGREDKAPHHLSYGQKKRVALAGVLAMEPLVLVLDEPTSGLDPEGEEDTVELLLGLRERGFSLVFATHNVDIVPQLADRIYLLHHGRMVGVGRSKEIFTRLIFSQEARGAHLRLPYVGRLLRELQEEGYGVEVELTVEEAKEELKRALGGRR